MRRIKTAKDYVEAAQEAGEFKMGGAQSKDTDEILTRMIDKAAEVKFTYIPFKSGAEAAVQLAGGHIDSHVNNPSESIGQWKGGTQRPLCVFSPQRLPDGPKVTATEGWHDIPTCVEQGLDIPQFQQPRTVWLPGKVTPDQAAFYVDLMKKVQADAGVEGIHRAHLADRHLPDRRGVPEVHRRGHRARPQGRGRGGLAGRQLTSASMISTQGARDRRRRRSPARSALAVVVSSLENGIGWSSAGVESGTFPFITGLIILAGSVLQSCDAGLLRGSRARVIGWGELKKLAALFVPAVIFVAAIPLLGMYVASAIYIFAVLVPQHHVSVARALVSRASPRFAVRHVRLGVPGDPAARPLGAALGF